MNIQMGKTIKNIRKRKGISQEVLAQALGVTFQAVSKWETGTALPDVALIPAIASFFSVSTDELFDFNLMEQEKKVMELCYGAAELRRNDPEKAEAMLREGLRQYPGNEIILNNLLYTMRTPERNEEVVTLCRSILEITRLDDVKYDVLRILAETYRDMGKQALVKPTLEQIPEIYFSVLELKATLLDGEEAFEAAAGHAAIARNDLLLMLARISQLFREKGEASKAADYADLARRVYDLFRGRDPRRLGFSEGDEQWLKEAVWSRLEG